MATVTKTRTYASSEQLTADNYNDDRDEIIDGVNDITNAQINASAAIAESKLSFDTSSGHDHDGTDSKRVSGTILGAGHKLATASTVIDSGTTYEDVGGATITFTPAVAVTVQVIATFGFSTAGVSTDQYGCRITIDGVAVQTFIAETSDTANKRQFVTVMYVGNLTAAEHTIKMQMNINAGSTSATIAGNATGFSYLYWSQ